MIFRSRFFPKSASKAAGFFVLTFVFLRFISQFGFYSEYTTWPRRPMFEKYHNGTRTMGLKYDENGRQFLPETVRYLEQFDFSAKFKPKPTVAEWEKLLFVTAASANHFTQLLRAIGSVHQKFPGRKIVVYDLGLRNSQRTFIQHLCDVEDRTFDFIRYPKFVRNLMKYRWKPIIFAEMMQQWDSFFYMDASVRWTNANELFWPVHREIRDGIRPPIFGWTQTYHSIFSYTNPKMYEFLPIDKEVSKKTMMIGAGSIYITKTPDSEEIVKWWLLCALERDCMAPQGSTIAWCLDRKVDQWKEYSGCHRFDQSALSILLARKYPENFNLYNVKENFGRVVRSPKGDVKPKMCH